MMESAGSICFDLVWPDSAPVISPLLGKPCLDPDGNTIGEIVEVECIDGKVSVTIESVTAEQKRAFASWCKGQAVTKPITYSIGRDE
jgi:hypothetical protein